MSHDSRGPIHVVTFVRSFDPTGRSGAHAVSALPLDDGGWLVTVHANGASVVRLTSSGGVVWARRGEFVSAIRIGSDVVGVGHIFAEGERPRSEPAAGSAPTREVWRLDDRGEPRWSATSRVLERANRVRLIRSGDMNVVATERGWAGIDDAGKVRWEQKDAVSRGGTDVIVLDSRRVAVAWADDRSAPADAPAPKRPCSVHVVEAATGSVRMRTELPLEGDRCALVGLAALGDALVVRIDDGSFQTNRWRGKRAAVVLDTTTLATRASIEEPSKRPALQPFDGTIGLEEVAFLDGYSADQVGALGLTIVDVARRAVRYVEVLKTKRGYIQINSRHDADRIVFEGGFTGELLAPSGSLTESEVREVDLCDAWGGVECFGTEGKTTTIGPLAGIVGTISLARSVTSYGHE